MAHILLSHILKIAVDANALQQALERVWDTFKIPSLYNEQKVYLEALAKGKDWIYMQVIQPGTGSL